MAVMSLMIPLNNNNVAASSRWCARCHARWATGPCVHRFGAPRDAEDACEIALGDLIRVTCALRDRSRMLWPPEVAIKLGQVLAAGKGIGPQWAAPGSAPDDEFDCVTAV